MSHKIPGEVDAEAAAPVELASDSSEGPARDGGDKSRAVELPSIRGEVIAVEGGEALCWVEVAEGDLFRTRIPLESLVPLEVQPGLRFERPRGGPARLAVAEAADPAQDGDWPVLSQAELAAEREQMLEEFERDLRHRRLFTRDRRAPE